MKRFILGVILVVLLSGCAPQEGDTGPMSFEEFHEMLQGQRIRSDCPAERRCRYIMEGFFVAHDEVDVRGWEVYGFDEVHFRQPISFDAEGMPIFVGAHVRRFIADLMQHTLTDYEDWSNSGYFSPKFLATLENIRFALVCGEAHSYDLKCEDPKMRVRGVVIGGPSIGCHIITFTKRPRFSPRRDLDFVPEAPKTLNFSNPHYQECA